MKTDGVVTVDEGAAAPEVEVVPPAGADPAGDAAAFDEAAEDLDAADTAAKAKAKERKPATDDDDDAGDDDGKGKPDATPAAKPDGKETAKKDAPKPADEIKDEDLDGIDMSGDDTSKRLARLAGPKDGDGKPKAEAKPAAEPAAKADPPPAAAAAAKPNVEPPPAASGDEPKITWKDPDTGNDNTLTVKEWEQQFPDFAQYAEHKARAIAKAMVDEMIESGAIIDRKALDTENASVASRTFDAVVSMKHENWRELRQDPLFDKWRDRLPDEQKRLFTHGGPTGAVALLDAFVAFKAKVEERRKAGGARAAAEKARVDGLHADSLAGASTRSPEPEGGGGADFEDEAERLDREERRQRRR